LARFRIEAEAAEVAAAMAFGRAVVKLDRRDGTLVSLDRVEYRGGDFAAAEKTT
jgi:hypothetical protein